MGYKPSIFVSINFPGECDWEKVIEVVDRFDGAHSFSFSHGVYYTGDISGAEGLIFELSKLNYKMQIMRNVD